MAGEAAIPVAGWIALGITVVVVGIYVCVQLCGGSDSSSSSSYSGGSSSGPVTASNVGAGMTAAYGGYYASQYAASQLANSTAGAGTKGGSSTKVGGGGKSGGGSTARGGSTTRGGNGGGSGGNSGSGPSGRPGVQQPPRVQQLVIPAATAAAAGVVATPVLAEAASDEPFQTTNPNALAALAAILGTNKMPKCDDDEFTSLFQTLVEYAAEEFMSSVTMDVIDGRIPAAVLENIRNGKQWLWPARGDVAHRGTKEVLQDWFDDGEVTYRNGGRNNGGPDFVHRSGSEVELKARKELDRFLGKKPRPGEYDSCGFAGYNWPGGGVA